MINPQLTHEALVRRTTAQDFNTAWGVTLPADLVNMQPAAPAHEAIRGLVMREVDEPELFKRFFG